MKKLDLTNTKAAIAKWKARDTQLGLFLDRVRNIAGFVRWLDKETKNDNMVREAFYKDTKDRNLRHTIMRVPVRDIIHFVETGKWR